MSVERQHKHSEYHRGIVPEDQLASGTPGSGKVPVGSGTGEAAWTTLAGASGSAGGVLSGTYPNPGFAADMATQAELDAHTGDTTDAHDASAISFDATGLTQTSATEVQTAIEDMDAAIDAISAGTFPHGTSNPGSPSTNDLFYRDDLKLLIVYDGTRWLTVNVYVAGGMAESLIPFSASGSRVRFGLWQPTRDVFLLDLRGSTVVATTNDGTKYWTCSLLKGSDNSTIGSFNTSADTANVGTNHLATINAVSTEQQVYLSGDKTSTPGNLYPFLHLTYRLVIT